MMIALFSAVAHAHALRPTIAEVTFPAGESSYQIVFQPINLEALIAEIGPGHDDTNESINASVYDGLRELPSAELKARFDGFAPDFLNGITLTAGDAQLSPEVISVIIPPEGDLAVARDSLVTIGGALPDGATDILFAWAAQFGDIVVRTPIDANGDGYAGFLGAGEASAPIMVSGGADQTALEAFLDYLIVGFEHILPLGLDHILFVIGLFLLSTALRPLIIQITAFTLAHTVTLALGALGYVNVPGSIVEPLIALSITFVAIENIFADKLNKWRPFVIFGFGLLHGLGFAGVLSEFGFAPGQFVASLIAFNIGVEIGQLTVIAICFLAVGIWFGKRDWYRPGIVYPASLAIGGYSFAWFIERSLEIELPILAVVAITVVIGAALLAMKGWKDRMAMAAYVLATGAALTILLRIVEGMIP